MAERRTEILQEAVDALAQTNKALTALKNGMTDDALEALALTTGKLALIVAREPNLSRAPTGVTLARHDIYTSPEAIEKAIERVSDALEAQLDEIVAKTKDGKSGEGFFDRLREYFGSL